MIMASVKLRVYFCKRFESSHKTTARDAEVDRETDRVRRNDSRTHTSAHIRARRSSDALELEQTWAKGHAGACAI